MADPFLDLGGSVVVVTGAGGVIGAGIARRLSAAGAGLVLHCATSRHTTEALAAELSGTGAPAVVVQADLRDPDAVATIPTAAIEHFGQLDGLVNNAGAQDLGAFLEVDHPAIRAMVDVNVTAPHLLTAAVARHLIARGAPGSIVHVASIEATQPAHDHLAYDLSKAALVMHARAAALELGRYGIRVNTVSPGVIGRPGIQDAWPEGVARWHAAAPLGRLGSPDDVGNACAFLLSPLASWITGIDLVVDGGVSVHPAY